MQSKLNELKKIACKAIDNCSKQLHNISKEIWNNPELNYQEHHAHHTLTEFLLNNAKIAHLERNYISKTGFRATFQSDTNDKLPHIAIMCEYDALPEIGHACGHNLIAEAGIGAFLGVVAAIQSGAVGKVSVFGTPAEEGGGGKISFIDNGAFSDVDAAMMTHPARYTKFKRNYLSIKRLKAVFSGKSAHAAMSPWDGVNAVDAAVQAYSSISNLRQQMKPMWRVHGIISDGGVVTNVIPERSEITYSIRAPNESELSIFEEKVINCIKAAALSTGCTVEIKFDETAYKNIMFNDPMINAFIENAKTLDITTDTYDPTFVGGSTDMGNVSHIVPAIHPLYSLPTQASNHTREFTKVSGSDEAQEPTIKQAKIMAMTTIDLFINKQLMDNVKQEFDRIKAFQN